MAVKKRTTTLDWEDLRYFVALARAGTLSGTARSLKVTHATVARRVARLERELGRELFQRRADGYVLTPEGNAVLDRATTMERAAFDIEEHTGDSHGLSGRVRLTTTRSIADSFLAPRLAAFAAGCPGVEIELVGELRVMSLARHEADLALRLGRPKDSDLVGRRLGALSHAFYAAGRPRRDAPLIGYDHDSEFIPEARWLETSFASRRISFRSNSLLVQREAARAGLGIALLPKYLVAGDRALRPINLGALPPVRELWLLTRRAVKLVPRVRAVSDLIVSLFGEHWPE